MKLICKDCGSTYFYITRYFLLNAEGNLVYPERDLRNEIELESWRDNIEEDVELTCDKCDSRNIVNQEKEEKNNAKS